MPTFGFARAVYLDCLGGGKGDLLPSVTPSWHHLPLIKVFVVTLRSGV